MFIDDAEKLNQQKKIEEQKKGIDCFSNLTYPNIYRRRSQAQIRITTKSQGYVFCCACMINEFIDEADKKAAQQKKIQEEKQAFEQKAKDGIFSHN